MAPKDVTLRFLPFFNYSLFPVSIVSVSAVQHSDPVIHIHTFFFPYYLPPCPTPRDWTQFPVLHSRTSWLIQSEWKSPAFKGSRCLDPHGAQAKGACRKKNLAVVALSLQGHIMGLKPFCLRGSLPPLKNIKNYTSPLCWCRD